MPVLRSPRLLPLLFSCLLLSSCGNNHFPSKEKVIAFLTGGDSRLWRMVQQVKSGVMTEPPLCLADNDYRYTLKDQVFVMNNNAAFCAPGELATATGTWEVSDDRQEIIWYFYEGRLKNRYTLTAISDTEIRMGYQDMDGNFIEWIFQRIG